MLNIKDVGKGLHRQPPDSRDFQYEEVMGAAPIDWTKGFINPEPLDSDQGSSNRCVGEAFSYFHQQLKQIKFSPRDIYSQIYLPQSGAYLRSGAEILCTKGQQTIEECGDPNLNNEANNRIKCGHPENATDSLEANYYAINGKSIDVIAMAIRDNKGCVIGIEGDNAGWHDMTNPVPPKNYEWGHALYMYGFHMHDGKKCAIAKSSWCNTGVKQHHIKEDYFLSGYTFDGWVVIRKETGMKKVIIGGTVFLKGNKGAIGVADKASGDLLNRIDDTPPETMDALDVPQVGTFTHDDAYIIHN